VKQHSGIKLPTASKVTLAGFDPECEKPNDRFVGEFLRALREEKGLDQIGLAEMVRCSPSLISKFESGSQPVKTTGRGVRLLAALGTSVRELEDVERGDESGKETVDRLLLVVSAAITAPKLVNTLSRSRREKLSEHCETALSMAFEGRYALFGVRLSRLTNELQWIRANAKTREAKEDARETLSQLYRATSEILTALDEFDMAEVAANLAIRVGEEPGDATTTKCLLVHANIAKARTYLGRGYPVRANQLLNGVQTLYEELGKAGHGDSLVAVVAWLAASGETHARLGDTKQAKHLYRSAMNFARKVTPVRSGESLRPGPVVTPSNIALMALRTLGEAGDGMSAQEFANTVDFEILSRDEQLSVWIAIAKSYCLCKEPTKALTMLRKVQKLAPSELRVRGDVVMVLTEIRHQLVTSDVETFDRWICSLFASSHVASSL
jgi:transcriptional regulator with XRE-family HTH domain